LRPLEEPGSDGRACPAFSTHRSRCQRIPDGDFTVQEFPRADRPPGHPSAARSGCTGYGTAGSRITRSATVAPVPTTTTGGRISSACVNLREPEPQVVQFDSDLPDRRHLALGITLAGVVPDGRKDRLNRSAQILGLRFWKRSRQRGLWRDVGCLIRSTESRPRDSRNTCEPRMRDICGTITLNLLRSISRFGSSKGGELPIMRISPLRSSSASLTPEGLCPPLHRCPEHWREPPAAGGLVGS
jgi:hypothetical protein